MRFFRRILVPHDGSEPATRALKLAAELARGRGGRLLARRSPRGRSGGETRPPSSVASRSATRSNGSCRRPATSIRWWWRRRAVPVSRISW